MTETTLIHNEEKWVIFTGGLLFWFGLWGLAAMLPLKRYNLTKFQENDLRNRVVSFIHGFMGLVFSAYQEAMHDREYGSQNTDYENALLTFSLAYFFYDMVAMAYYNQDGIGKVNSLRHVYPSHHPDSWIWYVSCVERVSCITSVLFLYFWNIEPTNASSHYSQATESEIHSAVGNMRDVLPL